MKSSAHMNRQRRFLALFLPAYLILSALSLVIWHYGSLFITERYHRGVEEQLGYVSDDLRSYAGHFDYLQQQLTINQSLSISYNGQPYSVLSGLQKTLSLLTMSSGYENIWYHCVGDDYWYSGSSSGDSGRLMQRFSLADRLESLEGIVDSQHRTHILSTVDQYTGVPCLLFFYRISSGLTSPEHIAIFQIRSSVFSRHMERLSDSLNGLSRLLDSQGNVLVQTPPLASPAPSMQRHAVSHADTGLTLELYVAPSYEYTASRLLLASTLVLLNLVFILISRITARRSYLPMQNLRAKISTYVDESAGSKDDYDFIESGFELVCLEKKRLYRDITDLQNAAEQFLFYSLLNSHVKDEETFRQESALLSVQMPEDELFVAVLIARNEQAASLLGGIQDELKAHFAPALSLCVQLKAPCCIVLIVNKSADPDNNVAGRLIHYFERLHATHWKTCTFAWGVSLTDRTLSAIPLLIAQAYFASNGSLPTAFYAPPSEPALPIGQLLDRLTAVRDEDAALSCEEIQRLQEQTLILLGERRSGEYSIDMPEVFSTSFEHPCEFYAAHLIRFLRSATAPAEDAPEEKVSQIDQINQYIQDNFDNPLFSIQAMADHFCMSTASISGFFKRNMGMLLTERITGLKMQKAQQLLRDTDLSVQAIGMSVGYYNVNSFIRRFRLFCGVTPGEFRQSSERDAT